MEEPQVEHNKTAWEECTVTGTIRHEEARDFVEISKVEYAAFVDHPVHAPGAPPTEHKIVETLREAGALTLSLVYEDGGEIVGHIAFSPALIDGEALEWYCLGPVAVRPDRQRQGIGSALIREGIRQLQDKGAAGIVLVGDPNYYVRFGFVSRPELPMGEIPQQYVLSLPLTDDMPSGEITAHEAFLVT